MVGSEQRFGLAKAALAGQLGVENAVFPHKGGDIVGQGLVIGREMAPQIGASFSHRPEICARATLALGFEKLKVRRGASEAARIKTDIGGAESGFRRKHFRAEVASHHLAQTDDTLGTFGMGQKSFVCLKTGSKTLFDLVGNGRIMPEDRRDAFAFALAKELRAFRIDNAQLDGREDVSGGSIIRHPTRAVDERALDAVAGTVLSQQSIGFLQGPAAEQSGFGANLEIFIAKLVGRAAENFTN